MKRGTTRQVHIRLNGNAMPRSRYVMTEQPKLQERDLGSLVRADNRRDPCNSRVDACCICAQGQNTIPERAGGWRFVRRATCYSRLISERKQFQV